MTLPPIAWLTKYTRIKPRTHYPRSVQTSDMLQKVDLSVRSFLFALNLVDYRNIISPFSQPQTETPWRLPHFPILSSWISNTSLFLSLFHPSWPASPPLFLLPFPHLLPPFPPLLLAHLSPLPQESSRTSPWSSYNWSMSTATQNLCS